MKLRIRDRLEDMVEADWGGALTYEAMNLVLLQILQHLEEELVIEFADGRVQKVRQLDNGWVGLRPAAVDRDAVTKRVGPVERHTDFHPIGGGSEIEFESGSAIRFHANADVEVWKTEEE